MPILMHLLLSFMKGARSNLKEEKPTSPEKPEMQEDTKEMPMPGNLIPSDVKKEEDITPDVLGVEDEVKTTPVNPVIEQKQ